MPFAYTSGFRQCLVRELLDLNGTINPPKLFRSCSVCAGALVPAVRAPHRSLNAFLEGMDSGLRLLSLIPGNAFVILASTMLSSVQSNQLELVSRYL